jgi:hypothetical protein
MVGNLVRARLLETVGGDVFENSVFIFSQGISHGGRKDHEEGNTNSSPAGTSAIESVLTLLFNPALLVIFAASA